MGCCECSFLCRKSNIGGYSGSPSICRSHLPLESAARLGGFPPRTFRNLRSARASPPRLGTTRSIGTPHRLVLLSFLMMSIWWRGRKGRSSVRNIGSSIGMHRRRRRRWRSDCCGVAEGLTCRRKRFRRSNTLIRQSLQVILPVRKASMQVWRRRQRLVVGWVLLKQVSLSL